MKSYKAYSNSKYLKKQDLGSTQVWTIKDAQEQAVTSPGKPTEDKVVLFFDGSKKGLVLNMSNGKILEKMTGSDDPEEWIGTQVELYVDNNVSYAGQCIGGIRLREPEGAPY